MRTPCLAFLALPFGVESMLHSQAGLYLQQRQYSQPIWKVLPPWHGGLIPYGSRVDCISLPLVARETRPQTET